MIWAFAIITLAYLFLMLFLLFGFGKVQEPEEELKPAAVSFTVVVPFRNESRNLPWLLKSLDVLIYPSNLFEILLVNDHSEDDSVAICQNFIAARPDLDIKLFDSLRKTGSPKKDAITTAIEKASFPYIITTDADCQFPETWLLAYSSFLQDASADMVAGPVVIQDRKGFLNKFQQLDFFSLQTATIGGFGIEKAFMCNGANLCFRKDSFLKVDGFKGNESIASGDDVFLLAKFEAAGLRSAYLKDQRALVSTHSQSDLRSLFSQRIRWAAKTSAHPASFPKFIGITVFLMNLLLIIGVLLLALGYEVKQYLLLSFLVKFNVDFVVISRSAHFFGREKSMKSYFWASFVYPLFCVLVVLFSFFSGYNWKGRKFRK